MGKNLRLFNLCTFFLWVSWISYSSSTSANIPSTNYIHYTMCIYIQWISFIKLFLDFLQILPSPTSHQQNMSWVTASGTPRASRSSTVSTILPWMNPTTLPSTHPYISDFFITLPRFIEHFSPSWCAMCVLNTWYIYVFPMDVNIDMDNWEILSKHKLS